MEGPVRDGDPPAVAAGDGKESVTVLHVDGPEAAGTAAAFLERTDGIEVLTATSADGALELLERERVDCVVSGHDPPDGDGVELLRAVREAHGGLPFVLFTDGGDEGLAREALAAGVTDYLPVRGRADGNELLAERVVETVAARRSGRDDGGTADGQGTDERRRERVLASLHDATRELMGAECEAEIADLAVRTARNVVGMPITGCWLYDEDERALLTVTSQGYGKRTRLSEYRRQSRYGKGLIDIKTNERNGHVVSVNAVTDEDGLVIMSERGQIMRTHVDEVSTQGRNTMGVVVMRLDDDDRVASVDTIPAADNDSDGGDDADAAE